MKENIRKKKIVFLLNDMDLGGVQKSMIALLRYLTGLQQYEIDLIVWQKGGALEKEVPPSVNILHQNYAPTWNDLKIEKRLFTKTISLFQLLRFKWFADFTQKPWNYFTKIQEQYDLAVSYVHRGYPLCFTIDKINAGKKILWFHHGIYEATDEQRSIDEIFYNLYDTIVAVSDSNKEQIARNFPLLKTELRVIPNLIEVEEIKQRSEESIIDFPEGPNEYNFVTVSRISKEKGIDLALNACYQLKNKGLKFKWYFIGDGDIFDEMTKFINDKKISDVCVLLGSKINPYPYMRRADLYIQPSYIESQCMTVYEALALKKLIVATDIPVLKEALLNGELGLLCEPDPNIFAETIERLMSDETCKQQIQKSLEKHNVSNEITYQKIKDLF